MSKRSNLCQRAVASIIAFTLVVGQATPLAYAGSTDISDVPLPVKNRVAPNIMLTIDNSGSMQLEFLPEEDQGPVIYMYPPPPNLYLMGNNQHRVPNFIDNNVHNFYARSSQNNKQYYNPAVTYRPWVNADGTPWPQAVPSAAFYNPANPGAGTLDLTVQATHNAQWFSDRNPGTGAHSGSRNPWWCDPVPCGGAHTYWPITYFKYNGSGSALARTSYTKVEIKNTDSAATNYCHTRPDGTTACRNKAAEVQNFANWFVYHRSRISSARAGISRAFSTLNETTRVGFAAINAPAGTIDGQASPGTILRGVRPFKAADRAAFYSTFFNVPLSSGTPLRQAADDIGQYFRRTDDHGPWGENPGSGGGTQLSCRQNFHILTTDGYWNNAAARTAGARANVDGSTGPLHTSAPDPISGTTTTYQYTPVNPWRDNWSNTLADVAMYYWVNDLRSDMSNNVFTSATSPAFWQHLTTYGVALGVAGTIPKATIDAALLPSAPTINWPNPSGGAARIDDLAHAAVNSRGGFFSAADPEQFAIALSMALDNIGARTSAGAAVGISSTVVVSGDDLLFASSYLPGFTWSGELGAYTIDPNTGEPSTTPTWLAQGQLNDRTADNRYIVSYNGSNQGVRFRPPSDGPRTLTGAQRNLLNTPAAVPPDGDAVIRYLRGERAGEYDGTYRRRAHLLGDIVNAQSVLVAAPAQLYADTGYVAFKKARSSRRKIVLQGANDGMLHAFDAADGKELWAYVPTFVLPNLNNLTRPLGYTHKFHVDGTPVVGDVDFSKTADVTGSPPPDWRTIAVGGLGKGGRGFYALDVTQTEAASELAAADKVLWEFPNASTNATVRKNVGYSFGRPIITKTRDKGWVVLVTSGYNNGTNAGDSGGDGKGYLFVLNPRNGELIKAIETDGGTPGNPSGLAYVSGYAGDAAVDNTVDYVYGGDLNGRVWRFDLTGTVANWKSARLATLVDGSGVSQPVATEPELARIKIGNEHKHFVYVGTGVFLGETDIPLAPGANQWSGQTQTIYGLIDDLSATPAIGSVRLELQQQVLADIGDGTGNRRATSNSVDFATKKGWYVDLPGAGERITASPSLATGTLVFTSNMPSRDPCILGGTAYFNLLDYRTGGYRVGMPDMPSSIRVNKHGLASGVTLVKTKTGVRGIVRTSAAETFVGSVPGSGSGAVTTRRLWKELRR